MELALAEIISRRLKVSASSSVRNVITLDEAADLRGCRVDKASKK